MKNIKKETLSDIENGMKQSNIHLIKGLGKKSNEGSRVQTIFKDTVLRIILN
jgi:regulatory protein YycI of two-component signal transduction system YycFG